MCWNVWELLMIGLKHLFAPTHESSTGLSSVTWSPKVIVPDSYWFHLRSLRACTIKYSQLQITNRGNQSNSLSPPSLWWLAFLPSSCHLTVGRLPWIRLNDGHVSKKVWPPDIHQHFYSKKSINGLILTSPRLPFIFLSTKKDSPFVSIQTLWFLWDWTDSWRLGLSLKCHLKFNSKAKVNKIPR